MTLPRKPVWVGKPINNDIDFGVLNANNSNEVTIDSNEEVRIFFNGNKEKQLVTGYRWSFGRWSYYLTGYYFNEANNDVARIRLSSVAPSSQIIAVAAENVCGCNMPGATYKTFYAISNNYLMVSPNPSVGETSVELVNKNKEVLDAITEWEFEVYDSTQGMKEKKIKIKDKQTKVNTTNWKDGVYIIRAKVGNEIIFQKFIVKH